MPDATFNRRGAVIIGATGTHPDGFRDLHSRILCHALMQRVRDKTPAWMSDSPIQQLRESCGVKPEAGGTIKFRRFIPWSETEGA